MLEQGFPAESIFLLHLQAVQDEVLTLRVQRMYRVRKVQMVMEDIVKQLWF